MLMMKPITAQHMNVPYRRWIRLWLIAALALSCGRPGEINNLNGNQITVLGHRGMGKHFRYPGNSFEYIEYDLSLGADGTEIDVQITRDSVLVVFHDRLLEGKTNCSGQVSDYTWSGLDSCRYTASSLQIFRVISVDELFRRLPNVRQYTFALHCKVRQDQALSPDYFRQLVHAIRQVVEMYGMQDRLLIESSRISFHQLLLQSGLGVRQFISRSKISDGIRIAGELGLYGISIGPKLSRHGAAQAHAAGLRVMTWTPKNRWQNLLAIRKNPDFIQTDEAAHMLMLFDKYREPGQAD